VARKKKPTRGEQVAFAVQFWDKTPFADHQRCKGAGCDCKGLLWGVTDELGFPEAQSEYAKAVDYSLRRRDGLPSDRLKQGFAELFDQVRDMRAGDVLLCKWDGQPGHIAIFDGERAWSSLPGSGVRSRSLSVLFHKFPLDSIWRWRD
jgi:cell wall-associated NlpC family hydrolase